MGDGEGGGSVSIVAIIAILILVLLAGYFVLRGGLLRGGGGAPAKVDVNVNIPK